MAARNFSSTTAFETVRVPSEEYRRPLSAATTFPKFSAEANVEEALRGCINVIIRPGIVFELRSYGKGSNFVVDFSSADLSNEDEALIKTISKHSRQIYSIRFSASIEHPEVKDNFIAAFTKFSFLPYLVEVDLSYCDMLHMYKGFPTLCSTLNPAESGYCPIKRLILTRSGLLSEGVNKLFQALQGNIYIEEIYLSGNKCTNDAMKSIADFLPQSKLNTLALGDNCLGLDGIEILAPAFSNSQTLRRLQVNNNPIGDDGATALILALREADTVEELNMSGCGLSTCAWSHRIRIMSKLSYLNVSHNKIADWGCQELCEGLCTSFCVRHLDISANIFHGQLCLALGRLIESNKGISILNLSYTYMIPSVWYAIGQSLQLNNTLATLDLRYCELTPAVVEPILEALEVNDICSVLLGANPLPTVLQQNSRAPSAAYSSAAVTTAAAATAVTAASKSQPLPIPATTRSNTSHSHLIGKLFESTSLRNPLPLSPMNEMSSLSNGFDWRIMKIQELLHSKVAVSILDDLHVGVPSSTAAASRGISSPTHSRTTNAQASSSSSVGGGSVNGQHDGGSVVGSVADGSASVSVRSTLDLMSFGGSVAVDPAASLVSLHHYSITCLHSSCIATPLKHCMPT